jgi:hypothetical protein
MARYSIRSTEFATIHESWIGHECTVCNEPFKKGEQARDLYVFKAGHLDQIEVQHDICPNGTKRNRWQRGYDPTKQVITLQDYYNSQEG